MREIFVFADISQSMFYRTLAIFNKPTFGIRFFSDINLAKQALILNGKALPPRILNRTEKEIILYKLMKEEDYFASGNYTDCQNIEKSLNILLNLGIDDQETLNVFNSEAEFASKNQTLVRIYNRYCRNLEENKYTDDNHVINEVIKAKLSLKKEDREFVCLKEFPLTNKQLELLRVVSQDDYKEISILDLFEEKETEETNFKFAKCYGIQNEIHHVFKQIRDENLNIDDCLIVDCGQACWHLADFSKMHNLPICFADGLPISFGNGYRVYRNIKNHQNAGNFGVESLKKIVHDPSFNKEKLMSNIDCQENLDAVLKIGGYMRLSFNEQDSLKADGLRIPSALMKTDNGFGISTEQIEQAKKLAKEFGKGISYVVSEYTTIRISEKERLLDKESIDTIVEELKLIDQGIEEIDVKLLIDNTIIGKDSNGDEALLVVPLEKALYSLRHHVFVIGASANNIPGGPKENYLLLDNDLAKFKNNGKGYIGDSVEKVEKKKKDFNDLLKVASSLNCDIRLSFSNYDYVELKTVNPSSLLYDAGYDGENATTIGYFDFGFSKHENYGKAYLRQDNIEVEGFEVNKDCLKDDLTKRAYSPSQINRYFDCPRHFYLANILGLDDYQEDDPNQIIPANDYGTLAHDCMNYLSENQNISEEEFIKYAQKQIDDYFTYRISSNYSEVERRKAIFKKEMLIAYHNDPHNEVITAEKDYWAKYNGLKIHGYPDRVEKDENGKGIIVDYKTYRTIKNKEDDVDTCLQVMIYGYIMEENGVDIDHCEYRYLSNPMTIKCDYKAVKPALENKLNEFKDALVKKNFPIASQEKHKEVCKYCQFGDICGKAKQEEEDE